ncbi:hypothetical protein QTQ03_29315 [Micromonospora sp. WMMA1363]|uniref:hypothetical protein n=1 Tax=Micromonospora sp. WMMA1363 TaxID=3053985 RepID=UPI00259CC8AC|nr:hypothetical protein [Micromonospora sp. WMMA1363]MDM4723480.1 hypothetical protein [Micromonospora sp. WMMA1363]
MSQPEPGNGLDELRGRRERRRREPPPPRHPKVIPATADDQAAANLAPADAPDDDRETAREIPREVAPETAAPITGERVEQATSPRPASGTRPVPARASSPARTGGSPLPKLEVDLTDPAAMMVTPTVLSIPGEIMRRFEQARPQHASHTALVLNALRAHAEHLPDLVLERRPGPRPGDLFPYRAEPGSGAPLRPAPLRIRPTAGELAIMDALSGWVNNEIWHRRPGGRKVSRSEVVAVALDVYLPQLRATGVRRQTGSRS